MLTGLTLCAGPTSEVAMQTTTIAAQRDEAIRRAREATAALVKATRAGEPRVPASHPSVSPTFAPSAASPSDASAR
jgi:hypothetical protein